MANNAAYGSLPFREQVAFFSRKLNVTTNAWTDVYGTEHDTEFMVAGANRDALLIDLRQAVEKAIVDGRTLQDFRKDFAGIITRHGWSYNGGFEWRSRVIYETNLRSSYMAGRFYQLMAMRETHPYWEYVHSDAVEEPREAHLAWDGMILRWDDPWWITHFPINAWGCQCGVIARTEDDLRRMGKSGPDTAPPLNIEARTIGQRSPGGPRTVFVPEGIDPGFEHTPGRSKFFSQVPPPRGSDPIGPGAISGIDGGMPTSTAPLLTPQSIPPAPWVGNAVEAFLSELGATSGQSVAFRDRAGQRIAIGAEMFAGVEGPITQAVGPLWLMANAIQTPDEIWAQVVWLPALQRAVVRRRYLARLQVSEQLATSYVMVEVGTDGWASAISPTDEVLQALRQGVLLYRREE